MKKFRIIGAGFSGLTLAYYIKKELPESDITIVEKSADVGGLLQTEKTPYGVVEKAANALLNSGELGLLAQDIQLELLDAPRTIKRAFILRDGIFKSWPLSLWETLCFVFKLIRTLFSKTEIDPKLSVQQWAEQSVGAKATQYLVDPALGGIYAAPIDKLSARLIFNRIVVRNTKRRQPGKRNVLSVAPRGGMNELTQALRTYLERNGVTFEFSKNEVFSPNKEYSTIFCGSLAQAQEFLMGQTKFREFFDLKMIPVTTTTCFYEKALGYKAFGVLYPRSESRAFLGTLLNDQVFPARYTACSETWIRAKETSETESLRMIAQERFELFGLKDAPLKSVVTHWPQALPLYDTKLEVFLREFWPQMREELKASGIYLHGNYLGKLGLSQVLIKSEELAKELVGV